MKKLLILLLSAISLTVFAQQKTQVAILEPIAMTKEVSTMHRSMVRGEMLKAIGRQSGYAAFTRTDIDQIMAEQNFQQSGMVDDATRKRLGAMQGVDYVCVTKITKEGNNFYLEANLVNIESGQISNPATQYGELEGGSLSSMLAACEKLAAELVGKTVGRTTSSYIAPTSDYVDLGLPSGTLWKNTNEGGDNALYTYDEAKSKFGNQLPTEQQFEELKNECTWTWTGNGYKVTGTNGNSITLPAVAYRDDDGYVYRSSVGPSGSYWSSTPRDSDSVYYLNLNSSKVYISYVIGNRYYERSVRLVQNL